MKDTLLLIFILTVVCKTQANVKYSIVIHYLINHKLIEKFDDTLLYILFVFDEPRMSLALVI